MTSHGTSNDGQRRFSSLKTFQNTTNNSRRMSRPESTTNSTIPKSLSTPDNTSPWHLRKSTNVR